MGGVKKDAAEDSGKTAPQRFDAEAAVRAGRNCLRWEVEAIEATAAALDGRFAAVLDRIDAAVGAGRKLIFSGVGKNVPVSQKLVATFNSTGVRSIFLDPIQAFHGDLGICMEGDLAFLLSNSGETDEVVRLLPALRRFGVGVVAVTADAGSQLATNADDVLLFQYSREGCPLDLAPTASTTAAQALGDALAMAYAGLREFSREDFARFHPGGALGRRLILRVRDVMRTGARMACLSAGSTIKEVLLALTQAKCGTAALFEDGSGRLEGVFTDGDFRRLALGLPGFLDAPVADHMTRSPKTVGESALVVEALKILERSRINDLVVVDADMRPVGLLDGQDLPRLKIY
ncbi:MAG: KpsF/GutQ family sugar-phosphate isomerase [Opitutales bacterium]|nr:KpsF/GutQ family sugar-phosphate isomerase [Opitutales bacterium]